MKNLIWEMGCDTGRRGRNERKRKAIYSVNARKALKLRQGLKWKGLASL